MFATTSLTGSAAEPVVPARCGRPLSDVPGDARGEAVEKSSPVASSSAIAGVGSSEIQADDVAPAPARASPGGLDQDEAGHEPPPDEQLDRRVEHVALQPAPVGACERRCSSQSTVANGPSTGLKLHAAGNPVGAGDVARLHRAAESRGYTMNRTLKVVGAAVLAASAVGLGAATDVRAHGPRHLVDSAPEGDVSVWAMGAEGENLGVLADAFMEEFPDISVEVTAVPWEAAHDKIVTAIAGGEVPDVSQIGTTWMGEFATLGGLEPAPDTIDPAQFFEGAWNTNVVDGVSYGVPWYVETRLVYYRTDLAAEGGFDQAPATWDELTQLAQATVDGGAEYGISLQPGGTGTWQTFMPFFWQAGGEIMDEDGNFTLDSPACVDALTFYDSFFEDGPRPADGVRRARRGPVRRRRRRQLHQRAVDDQHHHRRRCRPGDLDGRPPADPGVRHVVRRREQHRRVRAVRQQAGGVGVHRVPVAPRGAGDVVRHGERPAAGASRLGRPGVRRRRRCCRRSASSSTTPRRRRRSPTWEQIAAGIDSQIEQVTVGDASAEDACAAMQEEADSIGTGL